MGYDVKQSPKFLSLQIERAHSGSALGAMSNVKG
jgi:hypothetical protein